FFFQAEDGIRVFHVTGVQTCALPICAWVQVPADGEDGHDLELPAPLFTLTAAEGDGPDDAAEPVADGSGSDGSEDAAAGASGDAVSAAAGPAPALTWTALVLAAAGLVLGALGFVRSRPRA